MAKKAEEYGSHDKTFEIPAAGHIYVKDKNSGATIFEHKVDEGDVWRMCQTKDEAIQDWVRLAVERARATGARTIFWLDKKRGHDAQLIEKVNAYLKNHDTEGVRSFRHKEWAAFCVGDLTMSFLHGTVGPLNHATGRRRPNIHGARCRWQRYHFRDGQRPS